MWQVEVLRNEPYTECLLYDYDDEAEARAFAKETAQLYGVERVNLWLGDTCVDTWQY